MPSPATPSVPPEAVSGPPVAPAIVDRRPRVPADAPAEPATAAGGLATAAGTRAPARAAPPPMEPPAPSAPGSPAASPPVAAPPPGSAIAPGDPRPAHAGPLAGGVDRLRGARSELRRQLREQKRVRAMVLATVVLLVLGAPMVYFGIQYATRDPVLTSLDRLQVPDWAARSPEDRVASGSRWCFIDCRFRERTLQSEGETGDTAGVYQAALLDAGWTRWEVEGCPQVEVEGDYSCWTRDEYTLDLWVHPPECAYDPLRLRPDPQVQEEEAEEEGGAEAEPGQDGTSGPDGQDDCAGSIVEIKMQNRVADQRGLSGSPGEQPAPGGDLPEPTGSPSPGSPTATPDPESESDSG